MSAKRQAYAAVAEMIRTAIANTAFRREVVVELNRIHDAMELAASNGEALDAKPSEAQRTAVESLDKALQDFDASDHERPPKPNGAKK